jgi:hypothetical protein
MYIYIYIHISRAVPPPLKASLLLVVVVLVRPKKRALIRFAIVLFGVVGVCLWELERQI